MLISHWKTKLLTSIAGVFTLILINKSGCTACVDACNEENGLTGFGRPETDSQWIRKVNYKIRLPKK